MRECENFEETAVLLSKNMAMPTAQNPQLIKFYHDPLLF